MAEVELVALAPDGGLAGVSTAYFSYNERLRSQMWHVRVFVAGVDTRGPGIVLEVESLVLERRFPWAVWPITEFVFIGKTPSGAYVRVFWFPGATVSG